MPNGIRSGLVTLLLIAALAAVLYVFFTNDSFFEWAFERHQNTLSWVARPVLILPYCYFAYRRSLNGILLTVLAIATSMFWFPVPAEVDPRVADFLLMERERLEAGFDRENIFAIIMIVAFLGGLAAAFWRRSLLWGGFVAVLGAGGKALWSVIASPESGAAVIPFALGGLVLLLAVLALVSWRRRRAGQGGG